MDMASDVEGTALALDARLRDRPWYSSVGVGETDRGLTIFVYVRSARHRELTTLTRDGADGFPVIVRATGSIRALAG